MAGEDERNGRDIPDGWGQYRRLILSEIRKLQEDVDAARKEISSLRQSELTQMQVDIALLKLKNSLWAGLIGGLSGLLVTVAALLFRGHA